MADRSFRAVKEQHLGTVELGRVGKLDQVATAYSVCCCSHVLLFFDASDIDLPDPSLYSSSF